MDVAGVEAELAATAPDRRARDLHGRLRVRRPLTFGGASRGAIADVIKPLFAAAQGKPHLPA